MTTNGDGVIVNGGGVPSGMQGSFSVAVNPGAEIILQINYTQSPSPKIITVTSPGGTGSWQAK